MDKETEVIELSSSDEDEFVDAGSEDVDNNTKLGVTHTFNHTNFEKEESHNDEQKVHDDDDDDDDDDEEDSKNKKTTSEKDESLREEQLRREREHQLSPQERESRQSESAALKKQANALYAQSEFEAALDMYTRCLELCPLCFVSDHSVLHNNIGVVQERLGLEQEALKSLNKAIDLDKVYVKALLRRGRLQEKMDKVHLALEDFKAVHEIDKDNKEAIAALARLPEMVRVKEEKMKKEMFDNLKKLGNMVLNPFGLSTDNFQFVQDPNSGGYTVNFNQNPT